MTEPRTVPAWLAAQRSLIDELSGHLPDFHRECDGVLRVRWDGREFLLIAAPQVKEVTP